MAVQADWEEKDLYAVLGVAENADQKTIGRAYRKLARELHPDTHPDDPTAAERFKDVTAAYDVIGDAAKRAEYDEFRRAVAGSGARDHEGRGWTPGDGMAWSTFSTGDFSDRAGWSTRGARQWQTGDGSAWSSLTDDEFEDLLNSVIGGAGTARRGASPRRGNDVEAVLDLDFEDAVHGLTADVTVTGSTGPRTFKVRVPAGVDNGQRIRLAGKGSPGTDGGPAGDLYAVLRVSGHKVFGRHGLDLTVDAPISWPDAVLGAEVAVPTLDGSPVRVRVPAGTPAGRVLRVRGRGVRTEEAVGDLLVSIRVTVPDQLTEEQRRAVEAVAASFKTA